MSLDGSINIPLTQITAINRCAFNGIAITAVGNASTFYCIKNREEVIQAISHLLANSQQSFTQSATNSVAGNETERLMELKELLDMGAITQEEFELKKKEILGI